MALGVGFKQEGGLTMLSRRSTRWSGYGSAVLLLAVAILGNQVLDDSGWSWGWGAAALTAALATGAWDSWRSRSEPAGRLRLADPRGRPLPLERVSLAQLGVADSRFARPDRMAPHINRPIDRQLGQALDALAGGRERVVVVQGERLAGTTHALAHAAQIHIPQWKVAAFEREQELTLAAMLERAAEWVEPQAGVVVWLDAISLEHLGQLTETLLAKLPPRVGILVTLHTEEITGLHGEPAARLPSHVMHVLAERTVHLVLGVITPGERELIRAESSYQALQPSIDDVATEVLMGRLMVSLKQLRNALTTGDSEQATDRVALLRAATDWHRAQIPERLTRQVLQKLWADYRRHLTCLPSRTRLPADNFVRALEWAKAPASAGRPQLLSATAPYRPHCLLAVVAAEDEPIGWRIAPHLWDYALHHLDDGNLLKLGYTALDHGEIEAAAKLLERLSADDITLPVLMTIADHFYATQDSGHCRQWLTRAAISGHPDSPRAMYNLGILHEEQGQVEEAREWFLRAVESGHQDSAPQAMVVLGIVENEQGRTQKAGEWFLRAAESGHAEYAPKAMVNLGVIEGTQGPTDEAYRWLVRAVEAGHPEHAAAAMIHLGLLEARRERVEEARRWWANAVESGHPDSAPRAMEHLGMLEADHDQVDQAREWFVRAAETNHPEYASEAMVNLGILERRENRIEEARRWFVRAIDSGHSEHTPTAMFNLGHLEEEQGRVEQARHWYEQAVQSGHLEQAPKAMVNLGHMEGRLGQMEEARKWFLRAIETGHSEQAPKAMLDLGTLEASLQRVDQARHWYGLAAEFGHAEISPVAMVDLGGLEADQGRIVESRAWLARAITSEYAYASDLAQRRLRDLDRKEAELRRAAWYAKYGYLGSAAHPVTAHPPTASEDDDDT
ncbi:tetratricopeptide repeat protein [Nonomuraea sp. NPDC003709]|uniref:tetratricopeptide repeat protein n=1 Tax=Nonomuraea sp. NPDC003709 TaxID=3154450 RepID=UPI00339DE520